jgi:tetratricopeptide (TPR) repeat protein
VQGVRILEKSGMWVLLTVLILVASSSLIRFVTSPANPSPDLANKQEKYDSMQDAKFRSLFESGGKALQKGEYADALANYGEAEKVLPQLNEEQYILLKNAREHIAGLYAAAGSSGEAEGVYKTILASTFRDGAAHLQSGQLESALGRYQDATELTEHLTDNKEIRLIQCNKATVETLRRMGRLPDAVNITQQLIDRLQSSADEYDPAIIQVYMQLAQTYQMQRDWEHLEQTLRTSIALCDTMIAHYGRRPDSDNPAWMTPVNEDQLLYALIDAYDKDGKTDEALATAQTLYDFIAQHSTPWNELQPHTRKNVAQFAFQIASKRNLPDAMDTWRQRETIEPSRPY